MAADASWYADDPELLIAVKSQVDPVWWHRTYLGVEPWSKQREILESVRDHSRTSVRSCHGAGKTFIAAGCALWFLNAFPDSIVITTAPSMRQVKKLLWAELRRMHNQAPVTLPGKPLTTELQLADGWFALGYTASADDATGVQGFHAKSGHILVIADEAAGVSAPTYEGMEGLLSSKGARLLEIGNPTDPVSQFAKNQRLPGTNVIKIDAWDTPNFTGEADIPGLVTPEWVKDKVTRWGVTSPLYRAKIEAEFPDEAGFALVPLAWIEQAQERTLEAEGERVHTLDVARKGDDSCVQGQWQGQHYRVIDRWTKAKTTETGRRALRNMVSYRAAKIVIDNIGVGAGPADWLSEHAEAAVYGCNVGKAANDPDSYVNLRAEKAWNVRQRFEDGTIDIDPEDEELMAELAAMIWRPAPDGRISIPPKEELRKVLPGGRSSDNFDAMMLGVDGSGELVEESVSF